MDKDDSMFCNCLYYSANALGRAMTRMADEEFAITGLAPSHAFVLIIVNKNQGIRPGLIAEQMQLSPSTVTRLIEKMEHGGLILRKNVGKITEVYSTNDGIKLDMKLHKAWNNLNRMYSTLLDEEKAKSLTSLLYEASKLLP